MSDAPAPPCAFNWEAYPWLAPHTDKLIALAQAMRSWNERINLVSRKEAEQIEAHHILPCCAIARVADFSGLKTHLDIGTGGGLPGLVIALLYPNLECTLVDSTAKKLAAVSDMAKQLGLANVRTLHCRIETYTQRHDIVTGRAVTALPRFLAWTRQTLADGNPPAGLYYWKGGEFEPEIHEWNLLPSAQHDLHAMLEDPYFEHKYIAHYHPKPLLNNPQLRKNQRALIHGS